MLTNQRVCQRLRGSARLLYPVHALCVAQAPRLLKRASMLKSSACFGCVQKMRRYQEHTAPGQVVILGDLVVLLCFISTRLCNA